jgi:hypothetical protein
MRPETRHLRASPVCPGLGEWVRFPGIAQLFVAFAALMEQTRTAKEQRHRRLPEKPKSVKGS